MKVVKVVKANPKIELSGPLLVQDSSCSHLNFILTIKKHIWLSSSVTSMMSYYRVIEQNNAAVAMMKSGSYDSAISSFAHALKKVSNCQRRPNQDAHKSSLETLLHTSLDKCIVQSQGRVSFPLEQQDNKQYMHRQGIFIPFNLDSKYIPSILIFNLALAHHLSAQEDSDKRLVRLKKATRLYELAYNSQNHWDEVSC